MRWNNVYEAQHITLLQYSCEILVRYLSYRLLILSFAVTSQDQRAHVSERRVLSLLALGLVWSCNIVATLGRC